MAPRPRRVPGEGEALSDAAVLVLLYPADEGISLVLTRRTDGVARHRSQVSLPGGRRESGETLEAAALRECSEELAVDPESVMVLGRLSFLDVYASGFRIQPIVGWTERRPPYRADPREVAAVVEVGLDELRSPETAREETRNHEGLTREVPFFLVKGHKVWGATAMILSELLEVVREMG